MSPRLNGLQLEASRLSLSMQLRRVITFFCIIRHYNIHRASAAREINVSPWSKRKYLFLAGKHFWREHRLLAHLPGDFLIFLFFSSSCIDSPLFSADVLYSVGSHLPQ